MSNDENKPEHCKLEYYKLAINARNYHSDMALRWMVLYSTIVGALFIGYYSLKDGKEYEKIMVSILGLISTLSWYLSAKGYYYWVVHWINVVMKFEKEMELEKDKKSIYSLFYEYSPKKFNPIDGYNISTFKVTLFFISNVLLAWIYLLLKEINWSTISDCLLKIAITHPVEFLFTILLICNICYLFDNIKSDVSKHTTFKGNFKDGYIVGNDKS